MFDTRNYFKKRKIDYISSNVALPSVGLIQTHRLRRLYPVLQVWLRNKMLDRAVQIQFNTELRAEYEKNTTNQLDIGSYLNSNTQVPDEVRLKLLINPEVPPLTYVFTKYVTSDSKVKRAFRSEWLQTYRWPTYSAALKGPVCRLCVLFPPPIHRGLQGQFIINPCL